MKTRLFLLLLFCSLCIFTNAQFGAIQNIWSGSDYETIGQPVADAAGNIYMPFDFSTTIDADVSIDSNLC